MRRLAIAVHGGAGTISKQSFNLEKQELYKASLREATVKGYNVLEQGGTAMQAITIAVKSLEDNELFNAGKGSVLNAEGKVEMDAAVMEGKHLMAGAVAGVSRVRNPVELAKLIMEKSGHVLLTGKGAEVFAMNEGLILEEEDYFITRQRTDQLAEAKAKKGTFLDHSGNKKFGTVGAVARDQAGNLAAATSTGGMSNKMYGRIGDSPIIGAGTYANNKTCAISCTGHGEFFMRSLVAYDISCLMEYKGLTLKEACNLVIKDKLPALGGEGGLIAVDNHSNLQLVFNTQGMFRAWKKEGEELGTAIW